MTIVVVAHAPHPLLLADLVVTSRRPNPYFRRGSIPTLGTALPERGKLGARYLSEFRQKLVLINPYLAIGWAGDLAAARYVARRMRSEFAAERVSYQEVRSLLMDLGYRNGHLDGHELSLIGMISLGPGSTGYFCFGARAGKIGGIRYTLPEPEQNISLITLQGSGCWRSGVAAKVLIFWGSNGGRDRD